MAELELNFLNIVHNPENAEVDIVAVHGLDPVGTKGHAEKTWTANDKMWLRDFLPERLPLARILVFGYNANVAFNPSTIGVRENAEMLLSRLNMKRLSVPYRPIIFICHSLGGLVVKRALVIAQTTKRFLPLKNATWGIVFFATPHKGGNLVSLGKFVAAVVRKMTPGNAKNTLLSSLEKDGFFTDELSQDFRQQLEDYHFRSFYETSHTKILGKDVGLIVDMKSATFGLPIDREETLPLAGDHSNICKFGSKTQAYELVEDHIANFAFEAVRALESARRLVALEPEGNRRRVEDVALHELLREAKMQLVVNQKIHLRMMLKWLAAPDQSIKFTKACALKTSSQSTGSWFLGSKQFLSWNTQPSSWLWLWGIPGCGKTVLNSSVVETLQSDYQPQTQYAIIYFYFDFQDQKIKASDMIRSFIQQLCDKNEDSAEALQFLYISVCKEGDRQPTAQQLMSTFQQMLCKFERIFLVVDALDECAERVQLLDDLTAISGWGLTSLHVLLTSRRESDIFETLADLVPENSRIEIQEKDVNNDIRTWLHDQLYTKSSKLHKKFKKWKNSEQIMASIEDRVLEQASGMFLLATLQIVEVRGCQTIQDLKAALKEMPNTLDVFLHRILSNIKPQHRTRARKFLIWLTFSLRTLYVEEIEQVLAVNTKSNETDSEMAFNMDDALQNGEDEIFSICSSLVKKEQDSGTKRTRILLAHLSIKEYFLSDKHESSKNWLKGIQAAPSHYSIARTSLAYLLHFSRGDFFNSNTLAEYPLARYAAQYWFKHVHLAGNTRGPLDRQMKSLFRNEREAFANWIRLFNPDVPQELPKISKSLRDIRSPWYYASLLGLTNLIRPLLESISDINANVGFAGNALQAASFRGFGDTVALLLELGADVNARSSRDRQDALQAASFSGHLSVVERLLISGANVNSCGGHYGYALQAASYNGHDKVVLLLLREGAQVDAVGGHWDTALIAASWQGFVGTVKILLQHHANVNLRGKSFGTALQAASCDGREEVVDLLLEAQADVNLVVEGEEWYGTALQAAGSTSYPRIAKKLIDRGAEVNAQAGKYGTALICAAAHGHENTVQLLLEEGADIDAEVEGKKYKNAWEAACKEKRHEVKQLLSDWRRNRSKAVSGSANP